MQGLIGLKGVVIHLNAKFFFEGGNHALGDIVWPVVDIQNLGIVENDTRPGGRQDRSLLFLATGDQHEGRHRGD
nr:hypothetical protein NCPCFENI_00780 [Cupriavidus sp.]